MDTLVDTLMQSAFAPDNRSSEARSTDIDQFPRYGWKAEDVKTCLGYTEDEYNDLYTKVEEAMRHDDLLEVSLTGQRKIKLFALLNGILPHDKAPTVPDFLRIKALHQLAIRINHNVKTRSGHVHHRKRPAQKSPRTPITSRGLETRRPPPPPAAAIPNPPPFLTPQYGRPNPPTHPTPQNESHVMSAGHPGGLGNILLFSERDDNTQSVCSLKHIAPNTQPGAPITIDDVTLGPWKSILVKDGVMRGPTELITWKWGERRVKVPNDRVFRSVIEFMSAHGGFIDFDIEAAHSGEQCLRLDEAHKLTTSTGTPGARAKNKP